MARLLHHLFFMRHIILTSLLALFLLGGCSGRYTVGYRSPDTGYEENGHVENRGGIPRRLHIPPGHLPPPGSCRIWIPGVPPGRQSPPGDCYSLASAVPPGAWLLGRPEDEPEYFEVIIYDNQRPGIVVDIEWYVAASGEFVRRHASR